MIRKAFLTASSLFLALSSTVIAADRAVVFKPGARTLIVAHNAFPYHGEFGDRLDRAISIGTPFAVEQDLAWVDGRSLLIHGPKEVGKDDPTLESYFIPKIRPLMEKALRDGNKGNWPLVTLYLDIKNSPEEHLQAISKMLSKYESWLTSSIKPADPLVQAPLDLKPMIVLITDKENEIKQDFFYDGIPVGSRLHVFSAVTKPNLNPQNLPKPQSTALMAAASPEQIVSKRANTYRRWIWHDWALIEKGGQNRAGDWTSKEEDRLKQFVDHAHKLGYLVGFYCLNGYTADQDRGWDPSYNFGSMDAVLPRWKAAINTRPDFIATDQYEALAKMLKSSK